MNTELVRSAVACCSIKNNILYFTPPKWEFSGTLLVVVSKTKIFIGFVPSTHATFLLEFSKITRSRRRRGTSLKRLLRNSWLWPTIRTNNNYFRYAPRSSIRGSSEQYQRLLRINDPIKRRNNIRYLNLLPIMLYY